MKILKEIDKTKGVPRKVDMEGRITIPLSWRNELGIEKGEQLRVHCIENMIVIKKEVKK